MALADALEMSPLSRLVNRLLGWPLPRDISDEVHDQVAELHAVASSVNRQLQIYQASPDPFAALIADIYTQRQLRDVWRGME